MDNGRFLQEAQLIASEFKFFMVKGNLQHLYGYIYMSSDGCIKYPLEIKYPNDFPNSPPDFIFPQPIPNVPNEIELQSLNSWTSESHAVEVVRELAAFIKKYVEKDHIPLNKPIKKTISAHEPKNIEKGSKIEGKSSIIPDAEESEQYLTPNIDQFPYDQNEYINPDALSEWSPEEDEEEIREENDLQQEQYTSPTSKTTELPIYESGAVQGLDSEIDLQVSTEAALIQQEYAIDYVGGSMGIVEVYLTITVEQTFIIRIDFSAYPKKPQVVIQENLKKILGDVNETISILKTWNERKPKPVVELIREIEQHLWFLSDIEQEAKMVYGEYKCKMLDGLISHLQISLFTYGFKEYTLIMDISSYPAEPIIRFSPKLQDVLPFAPEELMALKNWKRKESHIVDTLREISWLVDKASRISFEVDLLKGGVKKVEYNKVSDSFIIELSGQLKTKDLMFKFEVYMHEDYPISVPKFKLLSNLEEYEEIKKKITQQIETFTQQWHPFNYLIDLFNQISKTIFQESIISCVICHKIDCISCGLKISSVNTPEEQCQAQCPSCERLYHKHCWDQTILSFGKCGFCLRPAPAHMRPEM